MRRLGRDAPSLLAQLLLTALGVYLGLRADQWRDDQERSELARATLRNFRRELAINRTEVARMQPYHDRVARALRPFVQRGGTVTLSQLVEEGGFDGTKPVEFTTTAWDLALATQALSFLDPALAFELSAVYKRQQGVARFTDQFLTSLFNTNLFAQRDVWAGLPGMENYFRETARDEERLLAQYDSLIPKIDGVLRR
jgi:hypothetical protein